MRFYTILLTTLLLTTLLSLNIHAFAQNLFAQAPGAKGPDFDGDGISDVVGFENQHDGSPNELAITWVSSVDTSFKRFEYGKSIQSSVPADYEGDGITDFAIVGVNETGEYVWQYKLSSNNDAETTDIFGIKDDLVFYGCSFDADQKADRAVVNSSGLFTYKRSSDSGSASFSIAAGLDRFLCADLNGDGIDEIIGQKTVKTDNASKGKKNKKGKKKKPIKQPSLNEKSLFYVWDLSGNRILDAQFGDGVKGIFAADTDGDGIKEFGFQRENGTSRTELVFYNGGAEKVFTVPGYLDVSFHNFSNTTGQPDGFVLKAKQDNLFLKYNSLDDLVNYQSITIPRADTVIAVKGVTTVGPVVSKETQCNIHVDPNDGNEGFLWKPVSDTTGNVAVLLPSFMRLKKVRIIKNNATIETFSYGGNGNGNRDHWRSSRRYTAFDENITVIGSKKAVNYCWLVPDPRKRID